MDPCQIRGGGRYRSQFEGRVLEEVVAFDGVAPLAASNHIGPDMEAASGSRGDMIDVLRCSTAVLAPSVIPAKDCLAGYWGFATVWNLHEVSQAHNRGKGHLIVLAGNNRVGGSQDVDLLVEGQHDCAPTRYDSDGFKSRV